MKEKDTCMYVTLNTRYMLQKNSKKIVRLGIISENVLRKSAEGKSCKFMAYMCSRGIKVC